MGLYLFVGQLTAACFALRHRTNRHCAGFFPCAAVGFEPTNYQILSSRRQTFSSVGRSRTSPLREVGIRFVTTGAPRYLQVPAWASRGYSIAQGGRVFLEKMLRDGGMKKNDSLFGCCRSLILFPVRIPNCLFVGGRDHLRRRSSLPPTPPSSLAHPHKPLAAPWLLFYFVN